MSDTRSATDMGKASAPGWRERSIGERFAAIVRSFGGNLAICDGVNSMTYLQLDDLANRIAREILERSGEGGEGVGIVMRNSVEAVAAILGILKAGKMYVPIAPWLPPARAEYMFDDSQARLVVTTTAHGDAARAAVGATKRVIDVGECLAGPPAAAPKPAVAGNAYANLFYTSGSTGKPKGVVDTHEHILYEAFHRADVLRITPADRLALINTFAFGGSVRVLFAGVLSGASVFIYDTKAKGVTGIPQWVRDNELSVISGRAVLRQIGSLLDADARFPSVRTVSMGGDTIYRTDVELCRKLFEPEMMLVSYASTEAGTIARNIIAPDDVLEDGVMPVGRPLEGKRVLVLDDDGSEITDGGPGEVALVSRFMAAGYWRRDELTRERFTDVPGAPGCRMFRTGDVGRFLPDGRLVHLGRKDFQVKIRGYRVETQETELALLETPGVSETVVVGRRDGSRQEESQKELVAYIVCASGLPPTVSALRRSLGERMPDYMVPTRYVFLEKMPRTVTGKVDRHRLPAPPETRPPLENAFTPPETPIERILAQDFSEVLKVSPVGIDDNFLDLGGHSLKAARIIARITGRFQVDYSVERMLAEPTLRRMALGVAELLAAGAGGGAVESVLENLE